MAEELFMVIAEGGVLLYSYPPVSEDDEILLSALVHALSAIQEEILRSEEGSFKFESGAGTLYVLRKGGLFFALLTKKADDKRAKKLLGKLAEEFTSAFPEAAEGVVDIGKLRDFDKTAESLIKGGAFDIGKLVDRFIREGPMRERLKRRARLAVLRRYYVARARAAWSFEREKVSMEALSALVRVFEDSKEAGRRAAYNLTKLLDFRPENAEELPIALEAMYARLFGKGFSDVKAERVGASLTLIITVDDPAVCSAGLDSFVAGLFEGLASEVLEGAEVDCEVVRCDESLVMRVSVGGGGGSGGG